MTEIALSHHKALLSLPALLLSLSTFCLPQTAPAPPATKADMVLINGTILTVDAKDSVAIPPEKLKDIKCEMTIFNGRIVYKDDHTLITAEPKINARGSQ